MKVCGELRFFEPRPILPRDELMSAQIVREPRWPAVVAMLAAGCVYWALKNRTALMPSAEQVHRAAAKVEALRAQHRGEIVIDAVVPDYYARLPKPCVGGWGRRSAHRTAGRKGL